MEAAVLQWARACAWARCARPRVVRAGWAGWRRAVGGCRHTRQPAAREQGSGCAAHDARGSGAQAGVRQLCRAHPHAVRLSSARHASRSWEEAGAMAAGVRACGQGGFAGHEAGRPARSTVRARPAARRTWRSRLRWCGLVAGHGQQQRAGRGAGPGPQEAGAPRAAAIAGRSGEHSRRGGGGLTGRRGVLVLLGRRPAVAARRWWRQERECGLHCTSCVLVGGCASCTTHLHPAAPPAPRTSQHQPACLAARPQGSQEGVLRTGALACMPRCMQLAAARAAQRPPARAGTAAPHPPGATAVHYNSITAIFHHHQLARHAGTRVCTAHSELRPRAMKHSGSLIKCGLQ